ncbi:MAG: hypothetical protein J6Y29_01145 [Clostridiales bacterium]|nr:hypothetical protein [Clostridiales bacterium]
MDFGIVDGIRAAFEAVIKNVLVYSVEKVAFVVKILGLYAFAIVSALGNWIMDLWLCLIKNMLGAFTISADMFDPVVHPELGFVTEFYHVFRTMGMAFLALIAMWQLFKSFFAYIGFEAEEPLKVGIRVLVFGALIMRAREIVVFILESIYNNMIKIVWSLYDGGSSFGDCIGQGLRRIGEASWISPIGLEQVIGLFLGIYLGYKLVLICFKLAERYVLVIFYMITFPLALSTGITKATRHFLQGWVKGFTGNLMVQFSQITMFIALSRFWHTGYGMSSFPAYLKMMVLSIALVKVLDKVEEFIRDIGLSGGISGSQVDPFGTIQSVYWKTSAAKGVYSAIAGFVTTGKLPSSGSNNGNNPVVQQAMNGGRH